MHAAYVNNMHQALVRLFERVCINNLEYVHRLFSTFYMIIVMFIGAQLNGLSK